MCKKESARATCFAKKNKVKTFLFFSSSEIYGINKDFNTLSIKEDDFGIIDPLKIRSCYALGKKMGENICLSWSEQYGVNVKIVRPFHTYGPKMNLNDGRVFADFVNNCLNGEDIIINSDGSAIRSYCYVKDAAIGFLKILLFGENKLAYNLGNPQESHSVKELADIIIKSSKKNLKYKLQNVEKTDYLKSELNRLVPSIEKIKKLGFNPKTSALEGFEKTIKSYIYD